MIKYPNGLKNKQNSNHLNSTSNRGMVLEDELNITNQYYLEMDKANIHKKPTPITIVHVDYPKRSSAKITEAYFKTPSTTDYNGVYRGRAIDFEAKECQSKTSFPFSSIHKHQIEHLKSVSKHGAISFLIISFVFYNEIYYIEAEKIINEYQNSTRKSLPYKWFKDNGTLIKYGLTPPIDYLKVIDYIYFTEDKND